MFQSTDETGKIVSTAARKDRASNDTHGEKVEFPISVFKHGTAPFPLAQSRSVG